MKKLINQPLASIHPEAKIGENVVIEPFATIAKDVVIGDGTWIGPNAVIYDGARIGKNCKIFPGAVIATIPQDLKYNGEYTTVEIGDNTTIREYATVTRGTAYSKKTVIGSNVLIMAHAHIAHDSVIENHAIIANAVSLGGHVLIGEYAIVGAMSGIHQFVNFGRHAICGGGALIDKDIPPFTKAARYPISYAGVNSIGMKRRGYSQEQIHHVQDIYRAFYVLGKNTTQALEHIEKNIEFSDLREEITSFVRESTRGIMKSHFASKRIGG